MKKYEYTHKQTKNKNMHTHTRRKKRKKIRKVWGGGGWREGRKKNLTTIFKAHLPQIVVPSFAPSCQQYGSGKSEQRIPPPPTHPPTTHPEKKY
jgi:hypothetical protein